MAALATFWLILWPLKKMLPNTDFYARNGSLFKMFNIRRTDDEAIAMLSANAQIAFPVSIFKTFFRFVSAGLLIVFVALALRKGYQLLRHFRLNHDPELLWAQILPFGAELIGLGLTLVGLVLLIGFIIQKLFHKPLGWLISKPINSILRKSSVGEDDYARLDVSYSPNVPEKFVTDITENNAEIAPVLKAVKTRSDQSLQNNRTEIMQRLAAGDGSLLDILGHGDLNKSLIHCNYFTPEMAEFLSDHIAKNLS